MAQGEGLINFLPNSVHGILNIGNASNVIQGALAQVPLLVPGSNKLALNYFDISSSNPHIWYFMGIMPRHYSGNGIILSFMVGFQNVAIYSNPFSIIAAAGFQRFDSGDPNVNIDSPSWGTQTSSTIGLNNITEMECQELSFYIPNAALSGITAGDMFAMYFLFQNASNAFNINAYIFNISLTEWT